MDNTTVYPSGPYPEHQGEPDCSFYLRTGLCGFGSTCRFNHPPNINLAISTVRMTGEFPERVGQPECQTGSCKFGATCKFHHPKETARLRVPVNILGYPLRPSDPECTYYLRTGQCKFGSTCKFDHPQPSSSSLRGSSGMTNLGFSRGSPIPRWQGASSYAPVILPQGMVSVPGWNAYMGQMGSVSSESPQFQTSGSSPLYGAPRQSETASQGGYSTFRFGSIPMGYYAFPERPGQPECQYYMKTGDCKFGAVCRFHHPCDRLLPTPDCLLSPLGLPLRQGEPLCIFYSQYGICKFGSSCKFDHPMEIFAYNLSSTATGAPSSALTLTSEGLIDSKITRLSLSDTPRETPNIESEG